MDFLRLTAEQRRAMDEDGFLVVPGALDREMVSRASEAVDRLAHAFLNKPVVVDRPETYPSTAARDTVFTWQVAGSGALSDLTTIFRDVSDAQPILAPGDRIVADGSLTGGQVHLWTLP